MNPSEQSVGPNGYLALPESGRGPGVLILHAWWGLNDFIKQLTDRFAQAGFVAFAPDLYHGRLAVTQAEARRLSDELELEPGYADIRQSIDYLHSLDSLTTPALGAVGFSLGAFFAFEAALRQPDDIGAVVVFYGTRPGDYGASLAAFQGHFAETDEFEPAADVQQLADSLQEAGRPVSFYTYPNTGHWFFEADQPAYNPEASELAWQRTVDFLRETLS